MYSRSSSIAVLWLPLLLMFSVWCAHAKKDGPRIYRQEFDSPLDIPQYFEDTDTVLLRELRTGVIWRSTDAGVKWQKVKDIEAGTVVLIELHPLDNKVAYALTKGTRHYVTHDQGESWKSFKLHDHVTPTQLRYPILSFHAGNSKKVIMNVEHCRGIFCDESAYYTTDGSTFEPLRAESRGCMFARGTREFQIGKDGGDDDRVLCVTRGKFSSWSSDNRLLVSDNWFKDGKEEEPLLADGRTVKGIINLAAVKGYIITAAKAERTTELAMYVTADATTWHRAEFPSEHKVEEKSYTILESTNYSIQVDVQNTIGMGVLFTSNSNGTYFSQNIPHTNRKANGIVDFEKVQGIQGIVLVNVVKNWKDVEKDQSPDEKIIQTQISFHDGRPDSFHSLKTADGKEFHLHSVTDMTNLGRVFTSPAPGLVMGVGNTGDHLKDYNEGDLYVSDDAGQTWTKAIDEAHKYEFGDQGNVLLAVYDEGPTDAFKYSIDHGQKWTSVGLDGGDKVNAGVLTTTPDSTSLKFLLTATKGGGSKTKFFVYSIDFEGLHERKCDKEDFEAFVPHLDDDGCIMGHRQEYQRRKKDADCFVMADFKEALPKPVPCACTKLDFECDFNFVYEDGKCRPVQPPTPPEGQCEDKDGSFMASSGFRLIPGNDCDRKGEGSVELDKETSYPCSGSGKVPASGKITNTHQTFPASSFDQKVYLERTQSTHGADETIIVRTRNNKIYLSKDHGKTWKPILEKERIIYILPHQYDNDSVFFLTDSKKVIYSANRGETFGEFEVPIPRNQIELSPLVFHQDNKKWLIWIGEDCKLSADGGCHSVAHYSKNRGSNWQTMAQYCRRCEFVKREGRGNSDQLVYCEIYEEERLDGPLQLYSSEDWFSTEPSSKVEDIVDFATMSEFIIVAKREAESLQVRASVDGKTFAHAKFPNDFDVPHQRAYTVLDSSTHAVFLHVTVGEKKGFEYGRLMKSNSNGTDYVSLVRAVNRNTLGYVDFEKMQGIEGVALVNTVMNLDEEREGATKKLRTLITHNDGADWTPLGKPEQDANGKAYSCSDCSLHLHGYTERKDPRHTYSSPSAIGLMMGVGNVGKELGSKEESDTFVTYDGGLKWQAVKEGPHLWEYGDQGSIIVILAEGVATNELFYTLDEGKNWEKHQFADSPIEVYDLTTVPSDNSRNFVVWGKEKQKEVIAINVDFSGLRDKACKLVEDESSPEFNEGDYDLWSPKHPMQKDNCLFGHVTQYHRKKLEAECWNDILIDHKHNIKENCSCIAQDFECDYNYERDSAGLCRLVRGLQAPDHSQACKDEPGRVEYYEPTGYRKIPMDTCQGGDEYDKIDSKPCPGHEREYEDEHSGLQGFWLFVIAILLPFGIAGGIGYLVWKRWGGKFGAIRLGDGGGGGAFDADRPWVRYPVAAVSGLIAVVAALPLLVGSVWRFASGLFGRGGRYTTRQSFARGRGDYAAVDNDEDELLGVEDDEEV